MKVIGSRSRLQDATTLAFYLPWWLIQTNSSDLGWRTLGGRHESKSRVADLGWWTYGGRCRGADLGWQTKERSQRWTNAWTESGGLGWRMCGDRGRVTGGGPRGECRVADQGWCPKVADIEWWT